MSNKDYLIENENNKIEPFDKIEQGTKRYIPNIPSVISDMKKNNIYQKEIIIDENINKDNKNEIIDSIKEENNKNDSNEKENAKEINKNNNSDISTVVCNYWNTFKNNETVSTIINPFQDDGECVNKVYKIYSCITITLILIVILLSITLS